MRVQASNQNLRFESSPAGATTFGTTSGAETQVQITPAAGAVNYINLTGAATGGSPTISAQGSDSNIHMSLNGKGTGGVRTQFYHTVGYGYNNGMTLSGNSPGGAPSISVYGSDTNVDLRLTTQGTGNITTTSPVVITNANISTSTGTGALIITGGAGIAGNLSIGGNITTSTSLIPSGNVLSLGGNVSLDVLRIYSNNSVTSDYYNTTFTSPQFALVPPQNQYGAAIVQLGQNPRISSLGVDGIYVTTNGALGYAGTTQLKIVHTGSAVNYTEITGGTTGNGPTIRAQGETNVELNLVSRGTSGINLRTGANTATQFRVGDTAGAVNYLQVQGGFAGNVATLSAQGNDTNVSMLLQPKGTTSNLAIVANSAVVLSSGTGAISAIRYNALGSGYSTQPTITISAPTTAGGVTATANASIYFGGVTIASGGTGYSVGDVLTVVGGSYSSQGQINVTSNSGGVITSVTVTNGGAYYSFPANAVSVTGGTGSGATFNLLPGGVNSYNLLSGGSGYVEPPTITVTGGGSGANAIARVGSVPQVKSLTSSMDFYTSNGQVLRLTDSTNLAVNYWQLSSSASGVQVGMAAIGGDTNIGTNFTTKGTGAHVFSTNAYGSVALVLSHTASAVNYLQVTGAATNNNPVISAQGSDVGVGLTFQTKSANNFVFQNGAAQKQLVIDGTRTGVNFLGILSAATGVAPSIGASTSSADTNVDFALVSKGTGNVTTANPVVITNANAAISTGTGALQVTGGAGISGNVFVGNVLASGFFYANGTPFVSSSYGNATVASYLPTYTGSLAASTDIVTLTANAGAQANQIAGANAAIVTANTALKAYTDAQITTTQSWVTGANAAIVTANTAMKSYVDTQDSAITTAWTSNAGAQADAIAGANAAIVTANTALKNYVDGQITTTQSWVTGANASIITANTALKGYVDAQFTNLTNGAPGILDTLGEIATSLGNNASLSTTLLNAIAGSNAAIVTANTAMKGYVDAQITTTQSWVTGANAAIVTANTALKGYTDNQITTANTALKSYVDTQDSAITSAWTSNAGAQANQITGANAVVATLQANVGSFYTYANTKIGTNTNSNLVVVATTTSTSTTTGALVVAGGAGIAGNVYVGGSLVTSGSSGNISGVSTLIATTVNAATIGNSGATLTGTLSTAAQTNITSVGTLTSLAVGAVTSSGTIIASTVQAVTIGNSGATLTGTLSTAAQTNITSVGNLTTLSTAGTTTSWGNIVAASGTASTSTTTGALVVAGGAGISGNVNIGGNITQAGYHVINSNIGVAALQITGTATKGGAGYHDFLSATNQGGGTNPSKWFRMNNTGNFEIINSAYTTNIFTLTDDGNITIPGRATVNALYTTTGLFWSGNNNVISTGGGGSSTAGLTGQVQYNNGGSLGATAMYYFTGNSAHVTTGNITAGQFYATNNGNGTNYAVGDDVWLGDVNIANTMALKGQQDGTQGYLVFGNTNTTNYIGRTGSNPITVTGAFATTGNTDVQSTLYGRGVYDNGTRVASTSGGPGNLSIVTGNITMSLTGPGAVTTGNSTAIPVITTDAYGRISSISTSTVSTTISLAGTSGTGSVSGGGTLTFAGSNGVTATASGSTITISTPQDLQTTALPTFANVTVANIIINTGAKRNGRNIVTNYSGNTAPATPLAGDEWFRGNTGVLYKYVFDNVTSTNNWIDISSALYNANTAAVANTIALRDSGGNLTATNFLGRASSASYADLAEMYTADDAYGPATVVVFGGAAEITVTTESHDPRVAGVISTNPAYLMNSELPNGLPVAFTGRVPCLVQGPVNKGDLLVTSATPGVAQRLDNSLFKPGCVVGKSLGTIQNDDIATIEVAVGRY
jgi:hypothetical protein